MVRRVRPEDAAAAQSSRAPRVFRRIRSPTFPLPFAPPRDVVERHDVAWRRLQSGDLRGASRDFAALLKQHPTLYPAETGLGFVHLADREFKSGRDLVLRRGRPRDALRAGAVGLAEAQVGLNNDGQAIAALERVLAIDPKREAVRTRLELVRFRMVQSLIDEGRRARQANRLDAAEQAFEQALAVSPSSTLILRELAQVELRAGRADDAEGTCDRRMKLDAGDAEGHAALGEVLEARGRFRDAAASYRRAVVDSMTGPNGARWPRDLSEKADMAALPREFGNLSGDDDDHARARRRVRRHSPRHAHRGRAAPCCRRWRPTSAATGRRHGSCR